MRAQCTGDRAVSTKPGKINPFAAAALSISTSIYFTLLLFFAYEILHGEALFFSESRLLIPDGQPLYLFTFLIFMPHIMMAFGKFKNERARERFSTVHEICYVLLGGFILLTWCSDPEVSAAEPLFILVSVSLATFEYRVEIAAKIRRTLLLK